MFIGPVGGANKRRVKRQGGVQRCGTARFWRKQSRALRVQAEHWFKTGEDLRLFSKARGKEKRTEGVLGKRKSLLVERMNLRQFISNCLHCIEVRDKVVYKEKGV